MHLIRALSPKLGLLAAVALALVAFAAVRPAAPVAAAGHDSYCSYTIHSLSQQQYDDSDHIRAAHDCIEQHHHDGTSTQPTAPVQTLDGNTPVATFYIGALGCGRFLDDGSYSFDNSPTNSSIISNASATASGNYLGKPYFASALDVSLGGHIVGYGVTVGPLIFIVTFTPDTHVYSGIAWRC